MEKRRRSPVRSTATAEDRRKSPEENISVMRFTFSETSVMGL